MVCSNVCCNDVIIFKNNNMNYLVEMLYDDFEKICYNGSEDEIYDYINDNNIDINYDDGYYTEIICNRNDLNLLKMLIRIKADIHINNEGILRSVAHKGYIELLRYLLENCNVNYNVLYESTACSNNPRTVEILKNYPVKC